MARVVAGDMTALGILFERYRQPLFRFLYRILRRTAWTEDLLQEAFLRVYDNRRRYTPGKSFSTWLYTMAYRLAIDALRREAHCDSRVDVETLATVSPPDFDQGEIARLVREAITALPEDQRVVVILREYEGFSYKEIAMVVGCTEEAARVRGHRARQALKHTLAPVLMEECEAP
ncbi:MAG: RNA polymerase sigma factor CarQ [bacterium ADurb.Bin429]|nr:MAG: RNA polymerase sigma factor CarQ [bacterium ADurb.Bin429]